jgi:KaiC/GvpD/RAD55 family RecA-like ATPase/DNA-binding response OmpR family regulator
MNGSTEVRSSDDAPRPSSAKTDVPLPLTEPVAEISAASQQTAVVNPTNRIISGIDLIDFGAGGLMPNHVYVVKGPIGVGKSVVGLQFLTRGLEHDEPGVLITDQKPANVLSQARGIGFQIDEAVKRNQLAILNPSSRYFELVESPADILAIVEELADYIQATGAKRVVIDPVYTLINTSYSSHFALTLTQSLINALEDLPVTTILIAGDEDDAEHNAIVRTLEQSSYGVIALSRDEATGGRLMRLSKLRYANNENLSAHYRILDGRGLINYRGDGEQVSDVTKPWEVTSETNRSVLLIGAQPDTIRRVTEALGTLYKVQAENDVQAGVERAKRDRPGLVLVSPSRSAAAVSAILDLAQTSASSLALISPYANRQSDKVLYLRAGADDFIAEPFHAGEFRARVDALIRRSGRRLTDRSKAARAVSADEVMLLMKSGETASQPKNRSLLLHDGKEISFDPEFNDKLQRNIETVSKFDSPFAVYWIKSKDDDPELHREMVKVCRQEDIVCHNCSGEFVCILTGADQSGVNGFEKRLAEKLGNRFDDQRVQRGYKLYEGGE